MLERTFKVLVRDPKEFGEPEEKTIRADHFHAHFGDVTFYRQNGPGAPYWPFMYLAGVVQVDEVIKPPPGLGLPPREQA